ncbi:MAG: hypothetical protein WB949_09775 [Candidatus Acidiferrales bacterium]
MNSVPAAAVKALVVSLACFLLFLLSSARGPVSFILFLLANTAFFFALVISFDYGIHGRARFALSYLAAVALLHLWAGALAVHASELLVAGFLFLYSAVNSAAQFLHGAGACLIQHPFTLNSLAYDWVKDVDFLGAIVIVVGLVALIGVFAMSRKLKFGYYIWLMLICVCAASELWTLLLSAIFVVDGSGLYQTIFRGSVWFPLFWPVSLSIAYWFAKTDAELK